MSIEAHCAGQPIAAFEPGDVLLDEGAATGRLYVLLEGAVEIVKSAYQINVVDERGAIFGEMSALLGIPHMATVRALTYARAYVIDDGVSFLQANQQISFFLAQLLAQRLNGVTSYLVDLKRQFEDHSNHLSMVDDILETLVHDQRQQFTPGSDREPDL